MQCFEKVDAEKRRLQAQVAALTQAHPPDSSRGSTTASATLGATVSLANPPVPSAAALGCPHGWDLEGHVAKYREWLDSVKVEHDGGLQQLDLAGRL